MSVPDEPLQRSERRTDPAARMRHLASLVLGAPFLLLQGCPATMHAFVFNASSEAIVVSSPGWSQTIEPGQTERLRAQPGGGPMSWRVQQGPSTRSYASTFSPPREHMHIGLFSTSIRVSIDAVGQLWLLSPRSDADTEPLSPQPPGFPIVPSGS